LAFAAQQGVPGAREAYAQLVADEQARAAAGRTSVSVGAPDIPAIIDAANKAAGRKSGETLATTVDELNKRAQGLSTYANNVSTFNKFAGEDQVVGGGLGVQAKELATGLGLGGALGIDQEALARQRAAQNLSSKIGIEELANLSGPDTDKDFERVLQAGPTLQQTPAGRRLFAEISQAKAQQAQRVAEAANRLSQQVEAGQLTVEQARERLRQEQEKTWLPTDLSKQLSGFTGGAAPAQPAGPKRFKFNADGTLTEG